MKGTLNKTGTHKNGKKLVVYPTLLTTTETGTETVTTTDQRNTRVHTTTTETTIHLDHQHPPVQATTQNIQMTHTMQITHLTHIMRISITKKNQTKGLLRTKQQNTQKRRKGRLHPSHTTVRSSLHWKSIKLQRILNTKINRIRKIAKEKQMNQKATLKKLLKDKKQPNRKHTLNIMKTTYNHNQFWQTYKK